MEAHSARPASQLYLEYTDSCSSQRTSPPCMCVVKRTVEKKKPLESLKRDVTCPATTAGARYLLLLLLYYS